MQHPTTFSDLIRYLTAYPDVRRVCDSPKVTDMHRGLAEFRRYEDGLMWFQSHLGGPETHMPINCGMTDAETGLEFHPTHFVHIKFGVRFLVYYVPAPDLQPPIGG